MSNRHPWVALAALLAAAPAAADPCGMVPPIRIDDIAGVPAIQRQGAQRTYMMFHQGVETIALRPGFTGKVDDFGMLIPFPTPPALRKIEDDTFAHLEALVDPPEVDVWLYDPRQMYMEDMEMSAMAGTMDKSAEAEEGGLRYDEVKVLNQEAVGMYQVAVLEAGSPKALQRWMEANGYRYPKGMDATVNDYVGARWCFVAIKATVNQMPGVSPKPGMREVNPKLPAGASFDGHVQGMGFRFKTDSPVIPMRLSVFNPDDSGQGPRNVAYLFTEGGVKLSDIPEETVVRQVAGSELVRRFTKPLNVRWHNGEAKDLDPASRPQLEATRDPRPHMHFAEDLVASDLYAISSGTLSLPFEEEEKELLRISESFGLRGAEIDALHAGAIGVERANTVEGSLRSLASLTLTVVDGSFPIPVLARQNLTLEAWDLPRGAEPPRQDPLTPPDLALSLPMKGG